MAPGRRRGAAARSCYLDAFLRAGFFPLDVLARLLLDVRLARLLVVFVDDFAPLAAAERRFVVVVFAPADFGLRAVVLLPAALRLEEVERLRVVLLLREVLPDVDVARLRVVVRLLAAALPPLRPPLRAGSLFSVLPRPEPDFFPPPSMALTVAQARRSASFELSPFFS